jgi:hypothetical protein
MAATEAATRVAAIGQTPLARGGTVILAEHDGNDRKTTV